MSVPAWFARGVFRLQEALVQRPTFATLREIERTQWLTPAQMRDYQTARLNVLLQTALSHSPWHAARIEAAGLGESVRAGEVRLDALARLPIMDKRDARENGEGLVWRGVPGGVFPYTTGGSSGEPLIFHFGRAR
ncbi:MAG: phenylacetate--CoA ligase family protein, partial [Thiobacillus sp.]